MRALSFLVTFMICASGSVDIHRARQAQRVRAYSMAIDLDPTHVRSWPLLRAYWRHMRLNCARCHTAIDYDSPRYVYVWTDRRGYRHRSFVRVPGAKQRVNVWTLDVGHIMGRDIDPRKEWAPIDTQPEHVRCNRQAGARYVNAKRGRTRVMRRAAILDTSRDW